MALLFISSPVCSQGGDFVIAEATREGVNSKYGDNALKRVDGWAVMVNRDAGAVDIEDLLKLAHANDYFNAVRWLPDIEHWAEEDYWATPIETLATNAGDCEDFSIGKYFSLEYARVDPEKLRITYVKSLTHNQAHMVLAYYSTPSAEPLILDNIDKSILPASERQDLLPIYSFNAKSIWLARARGQQLKSNNLNSLPMWKGLRRRVEKEMNKGP